MLPALDEIKSTVEQLVPGVSVTVDGTTLSVTPKDLAAVCRCLRDTDRFGLDYLSNLTAVDYPPEHIDLVYHLYSMRLKHGPLALRVRIADRVQPTVDSMTPIWRGAEYQEREVYDLFGVRFQGHPDLRRILMWEGFDGYPMRKDYVVEDQDRP